jgi:hypothetical protein
VLAIRYNGKNVKSPQTHGAKHQFACYNATTTTTTNSAKFGRNQNLGEMEIMKS